MKRKKIKQSIYRILQSEVLPYELPLFVSNMGFYHTADHFRLSFVDDKIVSGRKNLKYPDERWIKALTVMLNGSKREKESYNYYINKGEKVRELVFIHPYMQLKILDFYRKYESLILNFCKKSTFSLRFPDKRASLIRPKKNLPKAAEDAIDYKSNEIPKHYFHYSKYQNINAFYEGKEFQRLESRFSHLFKTDIKHCFDSIPIMKLAETLYQTDSAVDDDSSFGGVFSTLMKEMNRGREKFDVSSENLTCGVVIGPEFSRLFAEMFLQQIDKQIEDMMKEGEHEWRLHYDYECFRYVDDIFFFYNDDCALVHFYCVLTTILGKYGMRINRKKNIKIKCPLVSGVTKAKREIRLVVEKMLEDRLETSKGIIHRQNDYYEFPLKIQSQYVIMDIKTVVVSNEINLSDISASLLAYLHRKLAKMLDKINDLLRSYETAEDKRLLDMKGICILTNYQNGLVAFFRELIKVLFYIFNNDMRMSTSIRVLDLLSMSVSFCQGILFTNDENEEGKQKSLALDAQNKIFKTIVDELHFILKHNTLEKWNGLEICNILLITNLMPKSIHVTSSILEDFFNEEIGDYRCDGKLNVLMVLSLLQICGKDGRGLLADKICEWLISDALSHNWSVDNTECLLIVMTMMPSPYVRKKYKDIIIENLAEPYKGAAIELQRKRSPFVQWTDFHLAKACQMKLAAEVY